ncbi:hypothetical protein [Yinghuangia sp. YIM S10712]|uniref:hypothetical protein n=1 Tax=Yinghuangia sp. YIM S10712 TaxID=3436930 RepID=UPI003F535384
MSGDQDAYEVDVPLLLGWGTSNETFTVPGTDEVQRWPIGEINALDLRVVNDTDARTALRDAYPDAYTSSPTPTGEPLEPLAGLPRLEPHERDPASSEVEFDWYVGHLIDELGYVSHHSEAAAHVLAPKAQRSVRILTSLPEAEVPLRCAADAGFVAKRLASHAGPGGWLVRMLQYRSLDWMGMARVLGVVTPTYLSASTYCMIGDGRKALTPRLVTDFATLLGLDARALAALTGVRLRTAPVPPAQEVADAAVLLWETRRLSAAQAQRVSELARSMRSGSAANTYILNLPSS